MHVVFGLIDFVSASNSNSFTMCSQHCCMHDYIYIYVCVAYLNSSSHANFDLYQCRPTGRGQFPEKGSESHSFLFTNISYKLLFFTWFSMVKLCTTFYCINCFHKKLHYHQLKSFMRSFTAIDWKVFTKILTAIDWIFFIKVVLRQLNSFSEKKLCSRQLNSAFVERCTDLEWTVPF